MSFMTPKQIKLLVNIKAGELKKRVTMSWDNALSIPVNFQVLVVNIDIMKQRIIYTLLRWKPH